MPFKKKLIRPVGLFVFLSVLLASLLSAAAGAILARGVLHPLRRPLSPDLVRQADEMVARVNASRKDFEVLAGGDVLRGWKVNPVKSNGDWVIALHGVSDNRAGVLGHAEVLLRNGYSVLMMDARAHGESDGTMATFGWRERHDTRAILDALFASENVHCLFALGESMGGSIALQSAAVEPRIAAVVAESAFANLREVSYDYAGLRLSHWLGKTLFRPAAMMAIRGVEKEGGFRAGDISPEKDVRPRPFPVLLICGLRDRNIPARHTRRIYHAAIGPKQMWLVPGAGHTGALGQAPDEFERRVVSFFAAIHSAKQ